MIHDAMKFYVSKNKLIVIDIYTKGLEEDYFLVDIVFQI